MALTQAQFNGATPETLLKESFLYNDAGQVAMRVEYTADLIMTDHTATAHRMFYSDNAGDVKELALGASGSVLTGNGTTTAPSFTQPIKYVEVMLTDDATAPTVIDGLGGIKFIVPAGFNGMNLVSVQFHVTTASSSGTPTFQIYNLTQTADMLSTRVTIDINEKDSSTATTPAVIDTNNDDVATGDELRFDCDVVGTGTKGVTAILGFQLP